MTPLKISIVLLALFCIGVAVGVSVTFEFGPQFYSPTYTTTVAQVSAIYQTVQTGTMYTASYNYSFPGQIFYVDNIVYSPSTNTSQINFSIPSLNNSLASSNFPSCILEHYAINQFGQIPDPQTGTASLTIVTNIVYATQPGSTTVDQILSCSSHVQSYQFIGYPVGEMVG